MNHGLIQHPARRGEHRADLEAYLLPAVAALVVGVFLMAPWSLEDKTMAALHGLCAQRPSHSLTLGGQQLPFDARMTGIYGGFLVTTGYLLARGRYRTVRLPPLSTMFLLGGFVATLAVDGFNSLLLDLGRWHPYTPDNWFRLVTGLLTGISLATVICFLVGSTLWRHGDPNRRCLGGPTELLPLIVAQVPFALLVTSGGGWLFAPAALVLLLSATLVVGAMMLVVLVVIRRQEMTFDGIAPLRRPASAALVLAVLVMAAIAAGRFILEHYLGPPPLT